MCIGLCLCSCLLKQSDNEFWNIWHSIHDASGYCILCIKYSCYVANRTVSLQLLQMMCNTGVQNWLKILTSRRRWRWLNTWQTTSCSITRDDALTAVLNLCNTEISWIVYNVCACKLSFSSTSCFCLSRFMCGVWAVDFN